MTDLTELWKKGELPSGWYYVRLIRGEYRIDLYINGKNEWIDCPDNIIDTVVCEVPSYEQWEATEKYNKHLEEVIKIYERKDKQATETSIAYNELLEENAKLKELLKECRSAYLNAEKNYGYDNSIIEICSPMIDKIDEVLK